MNIIRLYYACGQGLSYHGRLSNGMMVHAEADLGMFSVFG